jgi:hypothetical protein
MEFKKFSAGLHTYGKSEPAQAEYAPGVTNVNFESELLDSHWNKNTVKAPINP